VLFYANRDEQSVIFANELAALCASFPQRLRVVHWLESDHGLPSPGDLREFASQYTSYDAFVCGPQPFMEAVSAVLKGLGFPRERHHLEKFVTLTGDPFTTGTALTAESNDDSRARLTVEVKGEVHTYDDWAPTTKLLDYLLAKGLDVPFSCRQGECSACAVRLVTGEVSMEHNDVLDEDDLADGIRLACQSVPAAKSIEVVYD
jgi:3-ketosteroid 9alpha-monooxygenase subunit B